ncbi:MAG: class I SAM-dependent methyltransferase [Gemmatimonadota bacterium]
MKDDNLVRHLRMTNPGTPEGDYRPFPEKPGRNARQQRIEVPLFVRLLGLAGRSRILEVGCGAGVALPVLHRLCSPDLLVGLDIDGTALRTAAEHTAELRPGVRLLQADVRSIPAASASFDAVVDFGTCYHVGRGDLAIREIERVLKPGGVFATESKLSQFLSHPVRSYGRSLRLAGSGLHLHAHFGLWISMRKTGDSDPACGAMPRVLHCPT